MGDREPRRRKKRKDSQKRDEIRSDDQIFSSSKQESHDSDQEVEEEAHGGHGHSHGPQASTLTKVIFVILFSGLIVSLSVIFISLRDTDKGPVDIFEVSHDDHAEESHDDHSDQALQDHDGHDEHEDEVNLEDLISSLGSIFSLNNEDKQESESVAEDTQKSPGEDVTPEPETSTDQSVIEEFIEPDEPVSSNAYTESTTKSSYSTPDYSESEAYTTPEYYVDEEPLTAYEGPDDDVQATPDTSTYEDNIDDSYSIYERSDITNEEDFEIRDQLDEIDSGLEKSPEKALTQCEGLLQKHPQSPRLHYMRAQALDKLAEVHRSNKHLEDAITAYQKAMSCNNMPETLYLLAGNRAADRLRFRGFTGKSVKLLNEMSVRFPLDVDLRNKVAVGYLLIGQNQMSKNVLLDVLKLAPDSGIAHVHLGFILKTDESKYEESIKYLKKGIASREPGVIDGRFYFHLGDALHRTGKKDEALKVYEKAVKEGLFLSVYQRSLYNVDGLTGKPWWDPKSTRYSPDFKILEKNWMVIRDEALSLIDEKYPGFMPETESLQDTGDWKQLELFARGKKLEKNCQKAPKTCALISQIPDAASCKRGQVKFSIMHPGTHVWAHTGPTNCRLRSHLGLVVPEGASIRVADEIRKWEEGKVILFDDSFEHEVWHNGSTFRLVLIVDFWHPELSAYQRRSLTPI